MGLQDYALIETLHSTAHALVGRYRHRANHTAVVVKALPAAAQIARHLNHLRYEYKLMQRVAPGLGGRVPTPLDLIEEAGIAALVMTDAGCTALRSLLAAGPLPLRETLRIGHEVAAALSALQVVHKDINPNNIVYNRDSGAVQVIDFDLASQLPREAQPSHGLHALEGTVAYVSPEQTGRTNVALDHRTDLYSLGVTLYELLAGHVPFAADDTAQAVYSVLTQEPPALPAQVPEGVAAIVRKLMQKDPEARYQSAFGLQHDLAECLRGLQAFDQVPVFALGARDFSARFTVPQRLYGREAEIARLRQSYQDALAGAAQCVLIAGPSGIGKSALVREVQPALVRDRGRFAAGKYDALQRNIPFSALAQALGQVVRELLGEPEDSLQRWRRRLQESLGNVGQAAVDLVPDLARCVGPQRPLPELAPQETENRLLGVLRRIVLALCKSQPLVLFLDDLQWADRATLKLLRSLAMEPRAGAGLLLIGAYRDDEVDAQHPLRDLPAQELAVGPLSHATVAALVVDATRAPLEESLELAELLVPKTLGNPFFLHMFLKDLWERELLQHDPRAGRWRWDMATLRHATIADNAAQRLVSKLEGMPPQERALLSAAACLGCKFTLEALCGAQDLPRDAVLEGLLHALDAGMLLPQDAAYRYARESQGDAGYAFAHDKVQQAAYALLAPRAAAALHLRIGEQGLARAAGRPVEAALFEITGHLNRCRTLSQISTPDLQLAELNLQAGKLARQASANAVAAEHLLLAAQCLPPDAWTAHAALARAITLARADAELVQGHYPQGSALLDEVLQHCANAHERAETHCARALLLTHTQRYPEAMAAGRAALRELGVPTPDRATPWHLARAFLRLRRAMAGRAVPALANAPFITDPRLRDIGEAWLSLGVPAFHTDTLYFALRVLEMNAFMVRHGPVHDASCLSGQIILHTLRGNYAAAQGWATVVQAQLERPEPQRNRALARFVLVTGLDHLHQAPMTLVERLAELKNEYLEDGLPAAASKTLSLQLLTQAWVSVPDAVTAVAQGAYASLPGVAEEDVFFGRCLQQWQRAMQGKTHGPSSLDDDAFRSAEPAAPVGNTVQSAIHLLRMVLAWLAEDYGAALQHGAAAEACQLMRASTDHVVLMYHAYTALSVVALPSPSLGQRRLLRRARQRLRQAASAGPIFAGVPALIDAELHAAAGRHARAQAAFERANAALAHSGHANLMAAGCERAGAYWLRQGQPTNAAAHLLKARDFYASWGALRKAQALDHALLTLSAAAPASSHASRRASTSTELAQIDTPALMEAAQALSSDLSLEALLRNLLGAAQRIAGASRAVLLLMQNQQLQRTADTQSGEVPWTVLHYAVRAAEPVALNDTAQRARFRDPYWEQCPARAVLAVPLVYQGKAKGVIYLENHLAAGAFAPARVTSVQFLASQAATSLESATLTAGLEEAVARRTDELRATHARLMELEKNSTEMQMAGGFAHEMRNALSAALMPLMAVLENHDGHAGTSILSAFTTQLNALAQGLDAPAARQLHDDHTQVAEALEVARQGVARGLELTRKILDFAETSQLHPGDDSVSLTPLVDRVLSEFSASFAAASITAEVQVDGKAAWLMRQEHAAVVLRNLLSNARDALAEAPTGERHIALRAEADAHTVTLWVRDNGPGMSSQVQERLFQPFFSTKGARGAGLGLGLCRKLIQVYGGRISFTSGANGGSEFCVQVPRA